jgi:hypothetical protein
LTSAKLYDQNALLSKFMRRKKMKKRHFLGFLALVVSVGFFIGCSTGS